MPSQDTLFERLLRRAQACHPLMLLRGRRRTGCCDHDCLTLVVRLGARNALYPPHLLIRNNGHQGIEITRLSLIMMGRQPWQLHSTMLPIRLAAGDGVQTPISHFRNHIAQPCPSVQDVPLQVAHVIIVDNQAVQGTTLAWIGRHL